MLLQGDHIFLAPLFPESLVHMLYILPVVEPFDREVCLPIKKCEGERYSV